VVAPNLEYVLAGRICIPDLRVTFEAGVTIGLAIILNYGLAADALMEVFFVVGRSLVWRSPAVKREV